MFEHSVLSTDVSRALRSSIAMAGAWSLCLLTGNPWAVIMAAPAAQNVALLDVRGDYRSRAAILLVLTIVLACSACAGSMAGSHLVTAVLGIGVLAMLAGCWRYLSGDYGPNFALASGLFFLLAMSEPGTWSHARSLMLATCLGGLGGILVQLAGWFFRPQHAVRHSVAETWVAASDLVTAMRSEVDDGKPNMLKIPEQEGALRTTADRTLRVIATTMSQRSVNLAAHLDDTTQLAARLATRTTALHTAMETIRARSGFDAVGPTFDSALRSLASALRSGALTIITHRPEQLMALDVRIRRASDLLHVLDTRLQALVPQDDEVVQVRQMLAMVSELLPTVQMTLRETVDHGTPQSGFALRLPDLSGMSMRSLGAWVNPPAQFDWTLVRYTLRVAAVLMVAVAIHKWFHIPRGHWIAFTALVVLQPDYGATRQKLGQRLFGTLAGSTVGSLLLWVKMPAAYFILCASVMAFCFAYFVRRRYGLAVFFVTLMIVLMTESMMPVHLDFTVERLLATLAGGVLSLTAAFLLWPKWEQSQSPRYVAAALRANRSYLETVVAHFGRGERFTGSAVLAKRTAEQANSQAAASLQRLLSEPSKQRGDVEEIATLTTYNQRLTRAITVLGQHLNNRIGIALSFPEAYVTTVTDTMEGLAGQLESSTPAKNPVRRANAPPSSDAPEEALAYRQLAKVVTEIDAIALAAGKYTIKEEGGR
ncbi:MAG TPA: FUSC family protein [Candidatus Saccharimonadia bacterium]|nr:FUSC family protein [Candidatus Saccharimonadia bacterium]